MDLPIGVDVVKRECGKAKIQINSILLPLSKQKSGLPPLFACLGNLPSSSGSFSTCSSRATTETHPFSAGSLADTGSIISQSTDGELASGSQHSMQKKNADL